ncbi:hypothetical protein M3J09_011711 [Ascochyta lentis]
MRLTEYFKQQGSFTYTRSSTSEDVVARIRRTVLRRHMKKQPSASEQPAILERHIAIAGGIQIFESGVE